MADLAQPRTIFVSIGNTDNRLTQQQWAVFYDRVDRLIRQTVGDHGGVVYGRWVSPSTDPYQNACWAFGEPQEAIWRGEDGVREFLRDALMEAAGDYGQDSVAWTEGAAEFLPGTKP